MKSFIEAAQKLIKDWEEDPDNYSKVEEGLAVMKAELAKFKDWPLSPSLRSRLALTASSTSFPIKNRAMRVSTVMGQS
jgi:hypothetical protein